MALVVAVSNLGSPCPVLEAVQLVCDIITFPVPRTEAPRYHHMRPDQIVWVSC